MRHRVHRFSTWNMSTPQVRKLFVILILATAFIFVPDRIVAMIQAKRSAQSSDLGRITSPFLDGNPALSDGWGDPPSGCDGGCFEGT